MSYGVDFSVTSSWNAGFIGSVKIKNADTAATSGWRVEFDAPFQITNLWNGEIVSHVGNHYVVRNASWNGSLSPNGSADFGFQASSQGPAAAPTGFTVNGQAAGTPTPPTPPALPALSISDASVAEGNTGTRQASFDVSLSKASAETVTVKYATADGTAAAGSDYAAGAGTITFAPGETVRKVAIPVLGDTAVEGNETFSLQLSTPGKATVADGTGIATIVNDDAAPAPLPRLKVSDVAVKEGTGGTTNAVFTVTLSAPASGKVSVGYASEDGTAVKGSDYGAASGSLVFNAGETTKTISIAVKADTVAEAAETFKLKLSAPSGATLEKAQGTATISDDDAVAPPRPTLSVADISVSEGNPVKSAGAGVGAGFFHTQGNQILDAAGHTVKIAGVNWFGMESDRYSPDGLNVRNYKDMMHQMADLGFNTIRLPFSDQLFDPSSRPNGIDFGKNPDLAGLSGLQIMDKIAAYAGEVGLKIILDHHRSGAGAGTSENGLWYNGTYNEQKWIDNWTMLGKHFAGVDTVIGADLHNEPHNGTWGGGGANDWAAAAERAGNAVLKANPNWLVFVEGVESYQNNYYWWGGNLMGVKDRPIRLDSPGHLVYSAHDYPNSIYGQPWFSDANFPNNLPAKFDQMWGYIARENIAPVYLGEFGSKLTDPKDVAWLSKLKSYLAGDYDANGTVDVGAGKQGFGWTWWSWNPNSGDTGGILKDDWTSVQTGKVASLQPLMFDFDAPGTGGGGTTVDGRTTASFQVKLSAASTTTVVVDYATLAGTADASDFTPTSGTLSFAPGETTKTVAVAVRGDAAPEPSEAFRFVLSSPRGADLSHGTATATLLDDDGAAARLTAVQASPNVSETNGAAPAKAAPLSASTKIVSDWGTGVVTAVTLKNSGSSSLDDWTIKLHSPLEITNIWNAEIVSHADGEYVIRAADWNDHLDAGQETSFGFQAAGHAGAGSFDWLV